MGIITGTLASRIAALVAALGTSWSLALDLDGSARKPYPTLRPRTGPAPRQSTNLDVIEAWSGTDRDPLKLSTEERRTLARDTIASLEGSSSTLNAGALMLAIGGAWRRLFVERLTTGRTFPAPSAEWTQRKARLGLSTLHMRASGQLLSAVKRARVIVQRSA
jgi:hypothetical protein